MKAPLTSSSEDSNKHEDTTTSYNGTKNQLSEHCGTDTTIAKANRKPWNFIYVSLTPWDLSQKTRISTLRLEGKYKEQTFRRRTVEYIEIRTNSTMCH